MQTTQLFAIAWIFVFFLVNSLSTWAQGRDLFSIKRNNKWGFIDRRGKEVITPQFDNLCLPFDFFLKQDNFSEGLACVQKGLRYGFISKAGKVVIPFRYDSAGSFADGLAPIKIGAKYGYINRKGKIVISPQYKFAWEFSEGLAKVELSEKKFSYIDTTGKIVIKGPFQNANVFRDGLAWVEFNRKTGFITKRGEFAISPVDSYFGIFNEGLAVAALKENDGFGKDLGFIDIDGKIVISPSFDFAFPFTEGLACVGVWDDPSKRSRKFGFVDKTGKYVVEPRFSGCSSGGGPPGSGGFSEGVAPVSLGEGGNKKFGYIDRSGKVTIDLKFERSEVFSGGLALVVTTSEIGYIDKNGEFIWKQPLARMK